MLYMDIKPLFLFHLDYPAAGIWTMIERSARIAAIEATADGLTGLFLQW